MGVKGRKAWNKGIPCSEEQKKNISKKLKKYFAEGNHYNWGKKASEESRKKMSESHKGIQCGENNPAWKGGISSIRNKAVKDERWKEVSKKIWERDNATCQYCGKYKDGSQEFHIHHIIPFDNESARYSEWNLILLCKECHISYIHTKKNTDRMLIDPLSMAMINLYRILKGLNEKS